MLKGKGQVWYTPNQILSFTRQASAELHPLLPISPLPLISMWCSHLHLTPSPAWDRDSSIKAFFWCPCFLFCTNWHQARCSQHDMGLAWKCYMLPPVKLCKHQIHQQPGLAEGLRQCCCQVALRMAGAGGCCSASCNLTHPHSKRRGCTKNVLTPTLHPSRALWILLMSRVHEEKKAKQGAWLFVSPMKVVFKEIVL